MGRELFTRAPHAKLLIPLRSITTIASGGIGYGPGRILRARNDLIRKAAVLIFGDHLDAWTIATRVDGDRSTIRRNDGTAELVRTPVVRIRS